MAAASVTPLLTMMMVLAAGTVDTATPISYTGIGWHTPSTIFWCTAPWSSSQSVQKHHYRIFSIAFYCVAPFHAHYYYRPYLCIYIVVRFFPTSLLSAGAARFFSFFYCKFSYFAKSSFLCWHKCILHLDFSSFFFAWGLPGGRMKKNRSGCDGGGGRLSAVHSSSSSSSSDGAATAQRRRGNAGRCNSNGKVFVSFIKI